VGGGEVKQSERSLDQMKPKLATVSGLAMWKSLVVRRRAAKRAFKNINADTNINEKVSLPM